MPTRLRATPFARTADPATGRLTGGFGYIKSLNSGTPRNG
jgi:hypothetical protein